MLHCYHVKPFLTCSAEAVEMRLEDFRPWLSPSLGERIAFQTESWLGSNPTGCTVSWANPARFLRAQGPRATAEAFPRGADLVVPHPDLPRPAGAPRNAHHPQVNMFCPSMETRTLEFVTPFTAPAQLPLSLRRNREAQLANYIYGLGFKASLRCCYRLPSVRCN